MVRVKDLKDQVGQPSHLPRPFLYCRKCGSEYSANAGDYFLAAPQTIMKCCGIPNILVTKQTRYIEV